MTSRTSIVAAEDGHVPAEETCRILLVCAGTELFGLPLLQCLEILEARSYTSIPGSGAWVCGLINLRGRPVTVFDLGVWLGGTAASARPDHAVLVLEHGGRRLGLAVDQVVRIVQADPEMGNGDGRASRPVRLDESDLAGSGWSGPPVYAGLEPESIFQSARA